MKKLLKIFYENKNLNSILEQVKSSKFLTSIFQKSNNNIHSFILNLSSYIQSDSFNSYLSCKEFLLRDIQYIKGVGPKRAFVLQSKKIFKVEDLLKLIPNNYRDFTKISSVKNAIKGETVCLKLKFKNFKESRFLEAIFYDDTSTISLKWFNYNLNYLKKFFNPYKEFIVYGKINIFNFQKEIVHPVIEEYSENISSKIAPVYPVINLISNKLLTDIIKNSLKKLEEFSCDYMPPHLIVKRVLPSIFETFKNIHFPDEKSFKNLFFYKKRLIYDEFLFTMLAVSIEKIKKKTLSTNPIFYKGNIIEPFLNRLSFELTPAQRKVLREIFKDFKSGKVVNRLIQGDVGSGKTLVAFITALLVIENKGQVAFMVPTEILAEQHYKNILKFQTNIKIALLTGSTKKSDKEKIKKSLEIGEIDLIIGTHALIQEEVKFRNLKLNIIDEQHKFGVKQRLFLKEKGQLVHTVIMTATPIPRTITLTLYGDLDVSVIDKLPPGRKPIKTFWFQEEQREIFIEKIKAELNKGRQAYFIYPLVEDSDKLDLKSVEKMSETLKNNYFKQFKLGILHGKMKPKDKEAVMEKFLKHKIDILVSTTVIEVGIDVPNATIMVIEHAERFGLSQLHQLRGRIGRGAYQSYCYLISSKTISKEAKERLKVMVSSNDGFKIAEADLKIRGPGEISGTKQSGMPEFQFGDLIRDFNILLKAKEDAEEIIGFDKELDLFPALKDKFKDFIGEKSKLITTG